MGLGSFPSPKHILNNGIKAAYNPFAATKGAFTDTKGLVTPPKNTAADEAAAVEAQRQQQIKDTTAQINQTYDSPARAGQQQGFFRSIRDLLTSDVNDQHAVAARQLKFADARSGNTGGSVAADNNVQLGKDYSKGLLDATRKAQGALADVQTSDSQSRQNLIQLAQTGLDTGSAASQAAEGMRTSLESARKSTLGGIPDAFKTTSDIFKRSQEAAEKRRGMTAPVGSLYGSEWS